MSVTFHKFLDQPPFQCVETISLREGDGQTICAALYLHFVDHLADQAAISPPARFRLSLQLEPVQWAAMSTVATVWDLQDPIVARIEDQINWYDAKSSRSQKKYKRIKLIEIIAAAFIPFLSALHFSNAGVHFPFIKPENLTIVVGTTTALLGVLITILEGVLQLQQYQHVWVTYRATCESLKHEKFTYIAGAGVYASVPNPHALLAERTETIGSQENTKWTSLQQPQKDSKAGS